MLAALNDAFFGRHGGFILASYVVTLLFIGALVIHAVLSHRRVRARLDAAEARGTRRRSARAERGA
jgi:heme exporter protein CcmD